VKRVAPLALLVVALGAGCGGEDDDGRLTVFAAASLTEVFERLDEDARFNFAGSDELATQLREGAEADVYAAASPRFPDELRAEGLLERPRVFATNRLVLIVPRDNPADIASLADLDHDGVKLVIGAEGVPIGDYTRTVLENAGHRRLLARAVSEEEDVKGVVGKVALGEAEAGFVYATDARAAGTDVRSIELPASIQARVEYPIALVRGTDDADGARRFVERLFSPEGRRLLSEAGFGPP
jgi:molybdate transport system substrate-binding protein